MADGFDYNSSYLNAYGRVGIMLVLNNRKNLGLKVINGNNREKIRLMTPSRWLALSGRPPGDRTAVSPRSVRRHRHGLSPHRLAGRAGLLRLPRGRPAPRRPGLPGLR